jgi:hypothetical protein
VTERRLGSTCYCTLVRGESSTTSIHVALLDGRVVLSYVGGYKLIIKRHICALWRKMPVSKNPSLKVAGVTVSLKDMLMIPSNFQKVMVFLGVLWSMFHMHD